MLYTHSDLIMIIILLWKLGWCICIYAVLQYEITIQNIAIASYTILLDEKIPHLPSMHYISDSKNGAEILEYLQIKMSENTLYNWARNLIFGEQIDDL